MHTSGMPCAITCRTTPLDGSTPAISARSWTEAAPSAAVHAGLHSATQHFFRPLQLVGYTMKTPLFSVSEFAAAAAGLISTPELHPGDAELLSSAGSLALPGSPAPAEAATIEAASAATLSATATTGGAPVAPGLCAAAPSGATALSLVAQSDDAAHVTLARPTATVPCTSCTADDTHPLRVARPSEQPTKPRKATFPRNYTPDHSLDQLSPEARHELYRAASTGGSDATGPLLPCESVLLRVALYEGRLRESVWTVHGEQTLLDLRRKLGCATSEKLRAKADEARERGWTWLTPPSDSAMIWIEGTFYVDGPRDISQPTREWIAGQRERLSCNGDPVVADAPVEMGSVRFSQLHIRLGAQYLFVHDGGCQHALVFEECSLLSPRDEMRAEMCAAPSPFLLPPCCEPASPAPCTTRPMLPPSRATCHRAWRHERMMPVSMSRYPRCTWKAKAVADRCSVCERTADFEIHGDVSADTFPLFLCRECKGEYHGDAEGNTRPIFAGLRVFPVCTPAAADGVLEDLPDGDEAHD